MDEHVHRAITLGLRMRGVDVLTVQEDDRSGIDDRALLARATELRRILFTQDDDLLVESDSLRQAGAGHAGIVFARQLGVSIGDCVRDLELVANASDFEELEGRVEFLPF